MDESNSASSDYNESENSSFSVDFNDSKNGCNTGTAQRGSVVFTDGDSGNVDINYSEIGDINISIQEIQGSEFAKVDSDDTADSDRYIEANSTVVTVKPYEINITSSSFSTSTGTRWLYDAKNIDDMFTTPLAEVSVYSKSGNLMSDFNSSCYGSDMNITFHYDYDAQSSTKLTLDGNLTSLDSDITDINKTVILYSSLFSGGKATATYRFGVDKNVSNPINPVNVGMKDITIDTPNLSKLYGSAKDTNTLPTETNATLYYGRLRADDIKTNTSPINQKLYFEIYSSNSLSSFPQDSINWYLNSNHTESKYGSVILSDSKVYRDIIKEGEALDVNFTSVTFNSDGTADLRTEIAEGVHGVAHLDINESRWLWYVPEGYGGDYNFSDSSDCSTHPCFNISRLKIESKKNIIESGSYEGMDFNASERGSYKMRGIKLFR